MQTLRRVSRHVRESVVREAFKNLLKGWGGRATSSSSPNTNRDPAKDRRYVDGALLHALRVPFGYWEAKDEDDDLDDEIEKKFRTGYPQDNIIFEDSHQAVLIQNKQRGDALRGRRRRSCEKLLELFFGYERPEIAEFRKAVEQFKTDLPAVLEALRDDDRSARSATNDGVSQARRCIFSSMPRRPSIRAHRRRRARDADPAHPDRRNLRRSVFGNADFHRDNNVAQELYELEDTFFTGEIKHQTLAGLGLTTPPSAAPPR